MGGYAWVTLATNDAYSLGALVLAHSLRRVDTKYELAVLITPGVTQTMREKLSTVFSVVMEVNVLDSKDEANLALLARPELGITFTKLHCWRLTQYEKCVFLDADTLVVRNCDELFEREELSAAPDVGWPDCFNSGVFVYKPSQQTFASITAFAAAKGSFDGGDQGLLNMYFSDWARKDISKHLPFIYNMCSTATYSYLPAFKQFGDDVRIIHFIGITKPWLQYFDTLTGIVQPPPGSTHLQPLLQLWWNIFCESVHPQLSPVMATSTLAPIWHEFTPVPFQHPTPRSSTYTDTTDRTQNDIYVQPDFSEFQDPWENYLTQNNSIIHETEDNVTQQYYPTANTSSPASTFVNQIHYEPPLEHSRIYYQEQYNESSHKQHNHNQEQSTGYINNETEQQQQQQQQQYSCFHPSDTSVSNAQQTWHNQHSVPVYNVQNHHSNESQHQHVDHQYISSPGHYDNNNSRLSSEETREHKHVDYQYVYQHSLNNNKSSPDEVMQQQQHNEDYVDNCNHYQTSNNEQFSNQHYEKENYSYESVHIKTDHDRSVNGNIVCQNDHATKWKTAQNKNVNFTDERTKTSISFSPHPKSKPCTDIHKVATQSDPHIMDDLSNSNGGLAGALAQITLGEPRSAEQIALEEHMRKQSWEQGHIDYMGRDSFDNIWKKICETLALAPPRLPSPPKETEKPAKTATDKTDSIKDDSIKSSDATQSIESVDEVDKGAAEATTDSEEQSLVNNVPITSVPKLSETNEQVTDPISPVKTSDDDISQKISVEPGNETLDENISLQTSNKQILEPDICLLLKETPQQTTAPIVSSDPIQSSSIGEQQTVTETQLESNVESVGDLKTTEQTKLTDIKDERYAKELCLGESTASEILTVSPVPIQVAESVLQVEPKESVPDCQAAPQEALSSTITSVFSVEAENKARVNGSARSIDSAQSEEKFSSSKAEAAKSIDIATKVREPLTESKGTSQISLPVEQVQSQLAETPVPSSGDLEAPEESTQKEEIVTVKESEAETGSGTGTATEDEKTKTLPDGKTPVRPSRAKEASVPSPSASKPAPQQDTKGEDKASSKKPVKKSAGKSTPTEEQPVEAAEGDGTDKKAEKKVMKKVVKKTKSKSEEGPDDGAEDNNSGSKQKKTVKVVKKSTKPSQPSSIETTVPETPSSSTSDAPVPPKRKTKPATPKSVTKKSDTQ